MGEVETPRGPAAETGIITSPRKDDADGNVTDILCLKVDHIGDLLIAAPALMRLRRAFPDARLTLVCSRWNAGLAERLELADRIVPVEVFDESSVGDLDHDALGRRLLAAAESLRALGLGPFDIAIDLTVHPRSRELLKLFPARVYGGFGDAATFPFLDVCAPVAPPPELKGPGRLRLTAADLAGASGNTVTEAGLHLTVREASLAIRMETDQVWSPSELGLADQRMLGAGLLAVEVREHTSAEEAGGWARTFPVVGDGAEGLAFDEGWADWEPWGRWSRSEVAAFRLMFPTPEARVRLRCRVQGQTGPHRPRATVWIEAGGRRASRDFTYGEGPATIALDVEAQVGPPRVRTAPFQLASGHYLGRLALSRPAAPGPWAPIRLAIRGTRPPRTLTTLTADLDDSGEKRIDLAFEVRLDDHLEPLILELRREGDDAAAPAPAIRGVELTRVGSRAPRPPAAHVEARLLDLVAMLEARHGPAAREAEADLARRLGVARAGSSAAEATGRLRSRKMAARRLIGLGVGANKPTKLWPRDYLVELGRRLLLRPEVDLVLVGGAKEAPVVLDLAARLAAGGRVVNLCGACRIEDLGEVLAQLDGYIGPDTGPTHFAGRVGVPTLAIFGHAHDPAEWGPVGARAAWIAAQTACAGCGLSTLGQCAHDLRCMTALTPDDVWLAVAAHLFPDPRAR